MKTNYAAVFIAAVAYWLLGAGSLSRRAGGEALAALTGQHGVKLRTFPQSLIALARGQASDVVGELAAKSAAARKIHDSYLAFRGRTAQWSRISIKAVLDARDG